MFYIGACCVIFATVQRAADIRRMSPEAVHMTYQRMGKPYVTRRTYCVIPDAGAGGDHGASVWI